MLNCGDSRNGEFILHGLRRIGCGRVIIRSGDRLFVLQYLPSWSIQSQLYRIIEYIFIPIISYTDCSVLRLEYVSPSVGYSYCLVWAGGGVWSPRALLDVFGFGQISWTIPLYVSLNGSRSIFSVELADIFGLWEYNSSSVSLVARA